MIFDRNPYETSKLTRWAPTIIINSRGNHQRCYMQAYATQQDCIILDEMIDAYKIISMMSDENL